VFIANDVAENFLFRNDGTGRFEEVGLLAGIAYDLYGSPQGSMGVDCGDYDNDGWLDFYQTSYQLQHAVLYRNLGDGHFEDATLTTGAGAGTYAHVTWGIGVVDFDNDGHRDLFIARGHLQDRVDEYDRTTSYRASNVLLRNLGDGRFEDVSALAGDGLRVQESSRGAAFDDLDNNGRIDAVILNSRQHSTILRNDSAGGNHWIQVRLVGVHANRDAVGSRVTVVAGDLVQIAEIHSGRSYQSHYGSRLHFGLGAHPRIDRLEIRWHGGRTQVLEDLPANQLHTIVEHAR
jgi:enediyne biosynthesis protein E4